MAPSVECPKCKTRTVVCGFRVGKATCNVCIDCGWCTIHNKHWPSVQKARAPVESSQLIATVQR